MNCVAFHGLRGGVGTTSTVAGVAHALHRMGCSLLAVDLTGANLLRWHLGLGRVSQPAVPTESAATPWEDCIETVADGFALLPVRPHASGTASPGDFDWQSNLAAHYDWVLVDASAVLPAGTLGSWVDLTICAVNADAACTILLAHGEAANDARLLITQYDPLSQLQRDVRLLMQYDYPGRMAPAVIHRDEAVAEALACGQAVGAYRDDSIGAQDMLTVATWLLALGEAQE